MAQIRTSRRAESACGHVILPSPAAHCLRQLPENNSLKLARGKDRGTSGGIVCHRANNGETHQLDGEGG